MSILALDLLGPITTLVNNFICWVETAVVAVINFVLLAVGTMVSVVVGLLPSMPSIPSPPTSFYNGVRFLGIFFDVQFFWTTLTTVATLYTAWLVIKIPLSWGKAVPDE